MNLTFLGSVLAFLATVLVAAIAAWQARRGARDSPYDALAKRVTDQEKRIEDLSQEVRSLRELNDGILTENIALVDFLQATFAGYRDGRTPPWPPIPWVLRHRITPDDLPPTKESP